ncbi:MAG: Rpn family recombination-promoting nuclease/putative transposase [Myxococcales bacterium]|nr:Rpn family recombination-promoting nuclease/putative transposase [Myxococcales bacterium]
MTPDDEPPEPASPAPALRPEADVPTEPPVDPHNPHDGLFRRIFADSDHAGSLLRAILPSTFVHNADWSTLTLLSGAFVDPSLRQSASDLLFSIEVDGALALVQLLIEHQSTPHPHMAWRVLGYQMRASERWLARRKHAGPLPIVIPVVVYCGERPWNAPLDLDALYGPLDALGPLTRCAPRTSYLLDDLTALSPAALVARGLPAAGTLALWALRSVARRDAPSTVRHVAHLFDGAPNPKFVPGCRG